MPFARAAIDKRIEDLENGVAPRCATVREKLEAENALGEEREVLRLRASQEEALARRCTSFWLSLEESFCRAVGHVPETANQMLNWFWGDKQEFLLVYKKRMR